MKCESCTKYDDCRTGSGLTWPCGAYQPKDKPNCIGCHHMHPDNGNCTAVGGFCTAVPAAYCPLIPELRAENEKLRDEVESFKKGHCAGCSIPAVKAEQIRDLTDAPKLRAELEQVKRLYESEKEDFLDYACSGIPNFAPYCFNRHPDCVDERGWCKSAECHGFSWNRSQKED